MTAPNSVKKEYRRELDDYIKKMMAAFAKHVASLKKPNQPIDDGNKSRDEKLNEPSH